MEPGKQTPFNDADLFRHHLSISLESNPDEGLMVRTIVLYLPKKNQLYGVTTA
jgi:hypothetical protein